MLRWLFLCGMGLCLLAQPKFEYWPGAQHDPAIPTAKAVLGFDVGERLAAPAQAVQYLQALQAAVPTRMKIFTYGKTWENRPLIIAVISSEANIRRLDDIKASMKRLGDPRKTSDAEARKIIATLPAIIELAHTVHGNESSGVDASLITAYHLLAARNDKVVADALEKTVILIDPCQNPDGRNRFVNSFEQAEGAEPDPFPQAAEHDEPWPGGRTNHYNFDMNRDWFALTQPETRGRIKLLLDWMPLVFADLHEMNGDSTYYFAPEAIPYNPNITAAERASLDMFGKNNAHWFDHFGFAYFTREVYDEFYPGYGASWPLYYGGIGMTYENAGLRGLRYQKSDGTLVDYAHSVQKHFVASISTCETAARNREKLLQNFWEYRKSAIEDGQKEEPREYILSRAGDVSNVDKLAHLLAQQGIEVQQAKAPFSAAGKDFPAGSYRVSLAQPMKRLAKTLLDVNTPLEKTFLAEQERRRRRRLRDEIYDVTAWSLPLQYGVETVALNATPSGGQFDQIVAGKMPAGSIEGGRAAVAYLVPWGSTASARLLTAMLREGVRVGSTDKPFTQNGRKYRSGTLIIQVKQNTANIHDTMARLVAESGAEVVATGTGWVEDGANFGSNNVALIQRTKVAIAYDAPVSSSSAGHTRWMLERQYGYPVTMIRAARLASADLSKYQVLILPEGGYSATLTGAAPRLKAWVQSGGTIVGMGSALSFLADSRVGLLAVQQESLARPGAPAPAKPETPATDGRVPGKIIEKEEDFAKAIQGDSELPDDVAGVLVRVKVDQEHWLTAGVPETVHALVNGRMIFTPIKIDRGVNAAYFKSADDLLASGYLWEENRKQLAFKPFVVVQREGRGHVIGFTADPNFRGYMDGLNVLFLNAVFRGAAHSTANFFGAEE